MKASVSRCLTRLGSVTLTPLNALDVINRSSCAHANTVRAAVSHTSLDRSCLPLSRDKLARPLPCLVLRDVVCTLEALLQIEEAKQVCRRCAVMEECLRWAIDYGQDAGVWGGMSEDERRALKRRTIRLRARAHV